MTYLWNGNILGFLNIWVYKAVLRTYTVNVMLYTNTFIVGSLIGVNYVFRMDVLLPSAVVLPLHGKILEFF